MVYRIVARKQGVTGTIEGQPMNSAHVAAQKLATMVEAARTLRDGGAYT